MSLTPRTPEAAFSLVEVVLAVGVLSLAVLALLGLFGPMMRLLTNAENRLPGGLPEALRAYVRDPAVQKSWDERWPKELLALEPVAVGNLRWSILPLDALSGSLPEEIPVRLWRIRLENTLRPTRASVGRSLVWRSQYWGSPEPGQSLAEFLQRPALPGWELQGFLFLPSL